jgi:hypothetical protein
VLKVNFGVSLGASLLGFPVDVAEWASDLGYGIVKAVFEVLKSVLSSSIVKLIGFLSTCGIIFVNALAKFMLQLVLDFMRLVLGAFTISGDMFNPSIHPELTFLTDFYHLFRTLGLAFLVLIATWQLFKSFFAYIGFEAEEPLKIGIRTMVCATAIMNAREIIVFVLSSIYDNITKMVWAFANTNNIGYWEYVRRGFEKAWENIWAGEMGTVVGESAILGLLTAYMAFKLFLLSFKLVERYVLTVVYMLTFPLALSTGTTKATRHYLQGWIKGFVGNLAVQTSQITVFVALGRFWHTGYVGGGLESGLRTTVIGAILAVSLIRALDKLEEFLRDIGLTAGIATGAVQGPLEFVQGIGWKISGVSTVLGHLPGVSKMASSNGDSYAAQQMREMTRRG